LSASHEHAVDVAHELERFTRACREYGTPVTLQRLAIYRALLESHEHPDAGSVYLKLKPQYPALSQATVFKTIEMLEGLGLVRKVPAPGTSRRFDANRTPHHHLWCVRCHALTDIESAELALTLPKGLDFQVMEYTIQFSGVCAACRAREEEAVPNEGAAR
jgi:Fur family peroxide stress response transcriptional regulator